MIKGQLFKVCLHDTILKLVPITLRIGLTFLTNVTYMSIVDELEDVQTIFKFWFLSRKPKLMTFVLDLQPSKVSTPLFCKILYQVCQFPWFIVVGRLWIHLKPVNARCHFCFACNSPASCLQTTLHNIGWMSVSLTGAITLWTMLEIVISIIGLFNLLQMFKMHTNSDTNDTNLQVPHMASTSPQQCLSL